MTDMFYLCSLFAGSVPFLAIVVIVAQYHLRRAACKRNQRRGMQLAGFCPSSFALATALLCMPMFYRPSLAHLIEARQEADADEDDQGDPETPAKHFNRQLKRIRRGETVETLMLRL